MPLSTVQCNLLSWRWALPCCGGSCAHSPAGVFYISLNVRCSKGEILSVPPAPFLSPFLCLKLILTCMHTHTLSLTHIFICCFHGPIFPVSLYSLFTAALCWHLVAKPESTHSLAPLGNPPWTHFAPSPPIKTTKLIKVYCFVLLLLLLFLCVFFSLTHSCFFAAVRQFSPRASQCVCF